MRRVLKKGLSKVMLEIKTESRITSRYETMTLSRHAVSLAAG